MLKVSLKDASDEEPEISGERELRNLGPRKNTEDCRIFVLHNGRRNEFACLVKLVQSKQTLFERN